MAGVVDLLKKRREVVGSLLVVEVVTADGFLEMRLLS